MNTQTINDQLRNFYSEHWGTLDSIIPKQQKYSYPLLMDANTGYASSPIKLFVVGQQANDWAGTELGKFGYRHLDKPVEELMKLYRQFNRGERYRGSYFFRATHRLQAGLNPDADHYGLMWSNLIPVDCECRVPPDIEAELSALSLLQHEIEITKPDVMVFFTGPSYEERLEATFPGVKVIPIEQNSRVLARLEHPKLPHRTYRTYHPNYLNRSSQLTLVINKIVDLGRSTL